MIDTIEVGSRKWLATHVGAVSILFLVSLTLSFTGYYLNLRPTTPLLLAVIVVTASGGVVLALRVLFHYLVPDIAVIDTMEPGSTKWFVSNVGMLVFNLVALCIVIYIGIHVESISSDWMVLSFIIVYSVGIIIIFLRLLFYHL